MSDKGRRLAIRNSELRSKLVAAEMLAEQWHQRADAKSAELIHVIGECGRLAEVLREIDEWDLRWAEGLDANVERIKARVRETLDAHYKWSRKLIDA